MINNINRLKENDTYILVIPAGTLKENATYTFKIDYQNIIGM